MAKDKTIRPLATVAVDKQAAAEATRAALDKRFGPNTVVRMGDRVGLPYPSNPTGIYQLDHEVIGIGGVPKGRIVEIYGPESSGKTTITLQIIAEAQAVGELAAFVDVEHALDPNWAKKMDVDVDALYVSQPDSGEQALEITETLVRSGAYAIVVVDSVAALVPQAELNGDMGDSHMGLQARLMSQACRKLTGAVAATGTTLIFINQIRDKIGVMFGSPETTTGGKALKFYASLRLDIRRIATVKEGDKPVGNRVKIKAVKNKMGGPFRECEVDLMFADGFSTKGSVLDAGVKNGAVDKAGAWYSFQGARLGQGRDAVIALLKDDPDTFAAIYAETRKRDTPAPKEKAA